MTVLSCQRAAALLSIVAMARGQGAQIPAAVPDNAGIKLPPGFVAFSIEQSKLPSYSGSKDAPNAFSMNLMNSLGDIQGVPPAIRSGGDTQDEIYFDPALTSPLQATGSSNAIGPSFFDSFNVWPKGTQLSFGFNLKNTTEGTQQKQAEQNLADMAAAACKGIEQPNLSFWELGNEPNNYGNHNMATYVKQWQAGAKTIQDAIAKACPTYSSIGFMGPSFSAPGGTFNEAAAFQDGLDAAKNIKMISCHNYIGSATSPGISLQGTLMNHQTTVESVKGQTDLLAGIRKSEPETPFILGESNSLAGGGAKGLSNVFGSAIWVVDFSLRSASQNIQRIHFHQSEGAPYSAWNPRQNQVGGPATLPPYYGNIAVASFFGKDEGVQVVDFPQSSPQLSMYGAYVDGKLRRMAVLNMHEFNSTETGPRPNVTVPITLADSDATKVSIQRLQAPGSDVTSGITFNGYSYDIASQGKPVNAAKLAPETIPVTKGAVSLQVSDSEVAILSLA